MHRNFALKGVAWNSGDKEKNGILVNAHARVRSIGCDE